MSCSVVEWQRTATSFVHHFVDILCQYECAGWLSSFATMLKGRDSMERSVGTPAVVLR
jgi:hypothetical protein